MMKVTATPSWQWTSNSNRQRPRATVTDCVRASSTVLSQTFLPRQLEVSFDFKYRR